MVRDRIILGAALTCLLATLLAVVLFVFFVLSAQPELVRSSLSNRAEGIDGAAVSGHFSVSVSAGATFNSSHHVGVPFASA